MADRTSEQPTDKHSFESKEYMRLYESKLKLAKDCKKCKTALSAFEKGVEDHLRESYDERDPILGDPSMRIAVDEKHSGDFEAIVFTLRESNTFKPLSRASLTEICNNYYLERCPDECDESRDRMTDLLVTFIWNSRHQHKKLSLKRKMEKRRAQAQVHNPIEEPKQKKAKTTN
jgi:hypothetical protein